MRNRFLAAVLGMGAVVGLNYLHIGMGAAATPPLTTVAHDATLAGSGRAASPLRVATGGVGTAQLGNLAVTTGKLANGAVTADKLGAGTPTPGQFLAFNGAALTWQTPPSGGGGLKVLDANGQLVGYGPATGWSSDVTRVVNGLGLTFTVTPAGLADCCLQLLYESADCSGTGYFYVDGRSPTFGLRQLGAVGTTLYFWASGPGTFRSLRSERHWAGTQSTCVVFTTEGHVDVPLAVDFAGLVPPFHLSE